MPRPELIPGVPPGLEYLTMIDELKVKQMVTMLEAFTGWEQNNKYVVSNAASQQVFYAAESTDTCMRICCGAQRSFEMHILDNLGQKVMIMRREFKCGAGCGW